MSEAADLPELAAFVAHLGAGDHAGATSLVTHLLATEGGIWKVIDTLIPAAMREVGTRWEATEWTVAQEHRATDICAAILDTMAHTLDSPNERAPAALVVCAEGEWHSLSSLAVSVALRVGGWRPVMLGPSVSARQLSAALYDVGPDFVALTCSLPANLRGARRMIVTTRNARTPVIVGGRGFGGEQRALGLGANAWAPTAGAILDAGRSMGLLTEPTAPLAVEQATDLRALDAAWGNIVASLADELGIAHAPDDGLAAGGVWLLRTLAAALLCRELEILIDHLEWHEGRARLGAVLPAAVIVRAVAQALPPGAPTAQSWLIEAAVAAGVELSSPDS